MGKPLDGSIHERDAALAARIILFMNRRGQPTLKFHEAQEAANITTVDARYFLASSKIPHSRCVQYKGSIANEFKRFGTIQEKTEE